VPRYKSSDSKNKTTKRKKATDKEPEEKLSPPSYPNKLTFVPKIYSDDKIKTANYFRQEVAAIND
jgi:hypothetical protein